MQFHFAFKHMDVSDALQNHAEQKLGEKIQKFITKPIDAKVTFSVDRHMHTAHCSIAAGDGFDVEVEHSCEDMYGSIDRIADKLDKQLRKQKEKLKDHRNHSIKADLNAELEAEHHASGDDFVAEEDKVDAGDIVKFEERRQAGT